MGVKIKDYIEKINERKQGALLNDQTFLIIKAGELHSRYRDKNTPSLIQCCSAMKQCMLEGDEILFDKHCKTGASAALTIKYQLHDLNERACMYQAKKRGRPKMEKPQASLEDTFVEQPEKKRGRPKGSKNKEKKEVIVEQTSNAIHEVQEEMVAVVKKRGRPKGSKNKHTSDIETSYHALPTIHSKEDMINIHFESWLKKERIKYEALSNIYLVDDEYGLWMIPKYKTESESESFISALKIIREDCHKCSILFEDTTSSRAFWNAMSDEVIERLNLSAFFISKEGNITRLA